MRDAREGETDFGFIAAIVAVATIGGFMFGYDSGVINGTQEGLEKAFGLSKLGTGFNVGAIRTTAFESTIIFPSITRECRRFAEIHS